MKILQRGELKHIATRKMKKAAKLLKIPPAPSVEKWLPFGVFGPIAMQVPKTCPLCLNPLSDGNIHEVIFNGKRTAVHKTCPEVKQ